MDRAATLTLLILAFGPPFRRQLPARPVYPCRPCRRQAPVRMSRRGMQCRVAAGAGHPAGRIHGTCAAHRISPCAVHRIEADGDLRRQATARARRSGTAIEQLSWISSRCAESWIAVCLLQAPSGRPESAIDRCVVEFRHLHRGEIKIKNPITWENPTDWAAPSAFHRQGLPRVFHATSKAGFDCPPAPRITVSTPDLEFECAPSA